MTMRTKIALVIMAMVLIVVSASVLINLYFTKNHISAIEMMPPLSFGIVSSIDITELGRPILNEFVFAKVYQELLLSALFLIAVGAIASVFISGFAVKPFRRMEELSETVKVQTEQIENNTNVIKQRDKLLSTVNSMSAILLAADAKENLEDLLLPGMELVGRCMEADRVQVWQKEITNGDTSLFSLYQWISGEGQSKPLVSKGNCLPYLTLSKWEEKFLRGESINSPVELLSQMEKDALMDDEMKSIIIIPIIIQERLLGLFSINDCRRERYLSGEEMDVLYSISRMLAEVINHRWQTA